MPGMRRNVCGRPARAPGFFGQPVRSLAVTAEIGAGPQKVCLPIHESHSTVISRTQAATGSGVAVCLIGAAEEQRAVSQVAAQSAKSATRARERAEDAGKCEPESPPRFPSADCRPATLATSSGSRIVLLGSVALERIPGCHTYVSASRSQVTAGLVDFET